MSDRMDTDGPFIRWDWHGANDGWAPTSYATLKEAVTATRYASGYVITRLVNWDVVEHDHFHAPQEEDPDAQPPGA